MGNIRMNQFKKLTSLLISMLSLSLLTSCNTTTANLNSELPENATIQSSLNNEFDAKGISKTSVIVKLKTNLTKANADAFGAKYNTTVKRTIKPLNVLVLQIPADNTSSQFIKKLIADPQVVYADPDLKVELDESEVNVNDPMIGDQYALRKVEASKAWFVNPGKDSVKIAIVDTGVDLDHPDLKNKLLPGYNALEPGKPPKDDSRHGTHVSGISAAISNNGIGVAGLAANCKIIPVKVLGANGGSLASIADGLTWAADNGADVVNMSLGTYTEDQTLGDAVKYALGKIVVCIATMGNDNMEKRRYPAAFPGMIAVGSTDENDKKSNFSNYGSWMTVSAPGSNILSSLPTYMSPNGYGKLSGTSMAAPLVTGLAALVRSQHTGMAPKDVAKILQNSADDLGDTGYDKYFGAGRINAFKAVSASQKR